MKINKEVICSGRQNGQLPAEVEKVNIDQLSVLRNQLMLPFGIDTDGPADIFPKIVKSDSEFTYQDVKVGTDLYEQAQRTVTYEYHRMYAQNGRIFPLDEDNKQEADAKHTTIVAVSDVEGVPVVFAALRVSAGRDLELYKHMERAGGMQWPYQNPECDIDTDSQSQLIKAGEFSRLAFHPILTEASRKWHGLPVLLEDILKSSSGEGISTRQLALILNRERNIIMRKMYIKGGIYLLQDGVQDALYIVGNHVNRFLHGVGIVGTQIPDVVQRLDNSFHQRISTLYPEYWHPENTSLGPKAYIAPWELGQIEWSYPTSSKDIVTEVVPAMDIRKLASQVSYG